MTEWRPRPISDLCTHIVDCVNKTAPISEVVTPFKMLRTTNVRGGWVDTSNTRRVSEAVYEKWTRRMRPQRGDVILTREAPLGEVGMLRTDEPVFLGQRLVMYRADVAECDPHFLLYSMLGPVVQAQLRSLGSGATVEHLRVPDCEQLTIPCPELPMQQRVGAVLGALDALIENNRRRVEVLEEMAREIHREWFVHFRYPGHERATLVESALGPIPDGWTVGCVSDVSDAVTRGIAPKYDDDGAWTVINQKCIRNERVSIELARRHGRSVPASKQVTFGDVLINSTGVGTLGRAAMYRGDATRLTVDSHVSIARAADEYSNPWYGMSLVARQPDFERLGTGSTGQTELSRADIGAVPIAIPPVVLRREFGDSVWPLLKGTEPLLASSRRLAALRDLLLPKLVSGQIDVSMLDVDALVEDSVA